MSRNLFSCYIIGEESLLIQCADILLERGHDIRGLISQSPAITSWAAEKGLPVLLPGQNAAQNIGPAASF
jgi:hypothetical protein